MCVWDVAIHRKKIRRMCIYFILCCVVCVCVCPQRERDQAMEPFAEAHPHTSDLRAQEEHGENEQQREKRDRKK